MAIKPTKRAGKKTTQLPSAIKKALDNAQPQIESVKRANAEESLSKQPRFALTPSQSFDLWERIYGLTKEGIFNEPAYSSDSRVRDAWLREVVLREPYLLGILQSCVSIDKNRGFTMTGGKIQVKRFLQICHSFGVAPDLFGWRPGISVSSTNFYLADLGSVTELARRGDDGPLGAIFAVDPVQCRLTGNADLPLKYGKGQRNLIGWRPSDYFRVTSFPSTAEKMNGLGYCAVSRCIELAKLMVSVFEHDREKLGSKAPKGILTINGVSPSQWLTSMEENEANRTELERKYYSGVQILAQNSGKDISVALTSLSNLPQDFDHREFTDMMIYGYALAFGYDPREFWPVSSGSLGSSLESETQHRRASSKGGLDFSLGFQEEFQEELPSTVHFEFEQRDVEGDISEADFNKQKLAIINEMFTAANKNGEILITREEARQLLVDAQLIPDDWTLEEEDAQVTDTDDSNAELIEKERVQAALSKYPDDDIVSYNSRTDKFTTLRRAGQKKILVSVGRKPNRRKAIKKKVIERVYSGEDIEGIRAEYEDAVFTTVRDYLDSSDRSTSYKSALSRNVIDAFTEAVNVGYEDGGSELPLDEDVQEFLTDAQNREVGYVADLFTSLKEIRDGGEFNAEAEAEIRAAGYVSTLIGVYNTAVLYGGKNKSLTFEGDDGENSCESCTELKGQRHKAKWWIENNYIPPTGSGLDCSGGGKCLHYLVDDDGNQVTL